MMTSFSFHPELPRGVRAGFLRQDIGDGAKLDEALRGGPPPTGGRIVVEVYLEPEGRSKYPRSALLSGTLEHLEADMATVVDATVATTQVSSDLIPPALSERYRLLLQHNAGTWELVRLHTRR